VSGSGSDGPGGSAPSGAARPSVTAIIDDAAEAPRRKIRKLRVTIVESPEASERGRTATFAQDEVRIGSSPNVDLPIGDPAVSREHLAVRLVPSGFAIADLDSTNGTFVGGLRVERAIIADETRVSIGKSAVVLRPLAEVVEAEISPRIRFGRMLGASAPMRQTFAVLEKVAATDLTVLVEGETGTGKELAAEGLHEASGRGGAFVAVNCGALPRELIESELFGHEKGAFTGAVRERAGAFVAANGGTLFLDEVGELPLDMQAKLLRALERREVKAVGSDRAVEVDVRVVAATNRALADEVAAGRFRQDLYYRLAVVVVRVPPLRSHPGRARAAAHGGEAAALPAPGRGRDGDAPPLRFPGQRARAPQHRRAVDRARSVGDELRPRGVEPRRAVAGERGGARRGRSRAARLAVPRGARGLDRALRAGVRGGHPPADRRQRLEGGPRRRGRSPAPAAPHGALRAEDRRELTARGAAERLSHLRPPRGRHVRRAHRTRARIAGKSVWHRPCSSVL
jgi:pSer/pThr/pTyr-binding forkhead associated (FHA) protein